MSKITLSFDLAVPEEKYVFDLVMRAEEAHRVLYELDQHLRAKIKYGELDESVEDALQEVRDFLHSEAQDKQVVIA